nr:putative ubiquitin carboxyl-terminal hydrolase 3 [Quercus suber]
MPPPQHVMPPPFQPRSPMVVSSTPLPQGMVHAARPAQLPQGVAPSPRPSAPPYIPHSQMQTSAAPPSPAPTPKHEQDAVVPAPRQPSPAALPQHALDSRRSSQVQTPTHPLSLPAEIRMPFYPKLPWYSTEEGPAAFPARASPSRKRRQNLVQPTEVVALPARGITEDQRQGHILAGDELKSEVSTVAAPSEQTEHETPATSQAPSESDLTRVSTPATPAHASAVSPKNTPTVQHSRRDTRSAIAVPNLPALGKPKTSSPAVAKQESPAPSSQSVEVALLSEVPEATVDAAGEDGGDADDLKTPPSKQTAPKSWADLIRSQSASATSMAQTNGIALSQNLSLSKSASLADALKQYDVQTDPTLSFIEPRGLVNTGNMCYMNSVRQRTVHSMKSDTPLVDAMIMFMREFKVLASAESVNVLRKTLKQEQQEQYGDPVTPEYVYDAIRKLPRFQSMRVS